MSGTFRCCPQPDPSPEETKKYKAYLTRLSKWTAFDQANNQGLIKDSLLRHCLIGKGELAIYLDAAWSKKIFSDKELFTDAGDGFWKVTPVSQEEVPAEPARWVGIRPGEDLLGNILLRAHSDVLRHGLLLNLRSRFLDDDVWTEVHPVMMRALESAKARGIEKPLNELQDRALRESSVDDDVFVQVVAVWLTNTRMLVDAMGRFLAAVKGDASSVQQYELAFYSPQSVRVSGHDDSSYTGAAAPTYESCLLNIRKILLNRGIISANKR